MTEVDEVTIGPKPVGPVNQSIGARFELSASVLGNLFGLAAAVLIGSGVFVMFGVGPALIFAAGPCLFLSSALLKAGARG